MLFLYKTKRVEPVDCPDDVASYIHRVGPTTRYDSKGRSVLFFLPFEMKMLERLQEKKIPVEFDKPNSKRLQFVSGLLAAHVRKTHTTAAFGPTSLQNKTKVKSIYKQKVKEIFLCEKASH
ncbi:putative RNA helicase [Helianthus anomalus]